VSAFGLSEAEWVALGAIGTTGTFAVALFLLAVQIWDRRGEAYERRMAQARLIAVAMGPKERPAKAGELGRTGIDLFNGSNEPIYQVIVGVVFIQGAGPTTLAGMLQARRDHNEIQPVMTLSILPPGRYRTWIPGGRAFWRGGQARR